MGLFNFMRRAPAAAEQPTVETAPVEAEQTAAVTSPASPIMSAQAAVQSAGGGVMITDSAQLEEYLKGLSASASGQHVTPDTALSVGAVFGCVRIISGAVATMPLDIKRRVDERNREDVSDHAVYRVLRRRPNRWMKPAAFKRMLQVHLLLRGNAYARIVRGGRGDVQELLPLNPDRVEPKQQPDLSVLYEYTRPNGSKVTFRQDEIMHLVGMTLDGINGVSVLTYARETIGLALAVRKHGADFFRNGTKVGSKLEHPGKVGLEGLEFLQASIEQYRSEKAHGTLVLEEGAKFENLGMTMDDAAFIDTLKLGRTDICMFFGVPPHMLGDTEKSTSWGSGIEQQSRGFVAYTLEDWLTTWEEGVGGDLIGDGEPDIYARFNRASLVRGDLKTRAGFYNTAVGGPWMNRNEARGLEDMNPLPGGDEMYPSKGVAGPSDGGGGDPPESPEPVE